MVRCFQAQDQLNDVRSGGNDGESEGAPENSSRSDSEIAAFIAQHPSLPDKHKSWLRARTINIGMTAEEVEFIYGKPSDVNRSVGSWGTHEQWVYPGEGAKSEYLYFENGKLTGWQD